MVDELYINRYAYDNIVKEVVTQNNSVCYGSDFAGPIIEAINDVDVASSIICSDSINLIKPIIILLARTLDIYHNCVNNTITIASKASQELLSADEQMSVSVKSLKEQLRQ